LRGAAIELETWRGQKIVIAVLVVLMTGAAALLTYGMIVDNDSLTILGFCIAIPTFFALVVNLGMLFAWSDRR
jgi:hypothetical protein